jgi:hypothetical protein
VEWSHDRNYRDDVGKKNDYSISVRTLISFQANDTFIELLIGLIDS